MGTQEMKIQGIDLAVGLQSCSDSMEIYCIILKSFYKEGFEKIVLIKEFYETKNYEKYRILVHGLKSVCYSIGAMELGQLAEKHEEAVKKGESSFIESNYDELIERYETLLKQLGKIEQIMRS